MSTRPIFLHVCPHAHICYCDRDPFFNCLSTCPIFFPVRVCLHARVLNMTGTRFVDGEGVSTRPIFYMFVHMPIFVTVTETHFFNCLSICTFFVRGCVFGQCGHAFRKQLTTADIFALTRPRSLSIAEGFKRVRTYSRRSRSSSPSWYVALESRDLHTCAMISILRLRGKPRWCPPMLR